MPTTTTDPDRDEPAFPTDAETERAAAETAYALDFRVPDTDHQARLAAELPAGDSRREEYT